MIKHFTTIIFFLCGISKILAQPVSAIPANIRATNTLDRLSDPNGLGSGDVVYGIPMPPGKVIGDTYLKAEWQRGTILLYDQGKMIEGYPLRYDIKTDELEIRGKGSVKVLSGSKIRSFVWIDSLSRIPVYFVNGKEYKNNEGIPLTGFFEIVEDGRMPILKKTTITIRKADYSVALDVGSRDDKILKKHDYYYALDHQVNEVPSSRKKLYAIFGNRAEEIEGFVKNNNLNITREDHLREIFRYYNAK
jgi:hypothetical protein